MNIKAISILFMFIILAGCDDFLEISPQGQLTQEAFPKTQADALLAVNACYSTSRSWHYHSGGFPILDIMSDDAHKGSNPNDQVPTLGPYESFNLTATQDGLDRWWSTLYEGIKRCNVVIENIPEIDMDESLQNTYLAEAKFLRGMFYFDLVRAWGGVPIVITSSPERNLPRDTREKV
jgi:hypothetical protein